MRTKNSWGKQNKFIKKVLYIIIIILIIYNALYVLNNAIYSKKYINLFGNIFIMTEKDNAMSPTIKKNDFVILKKVKASKINNNDIIGYDINNEITIRRVVSIEQNSYETKADNYYHNDLERKNIEQINGKILFKISFIGIIFKYFENKIITIFIILILLLRFSFNKYVKNRREESKKKLDKELRRKTKI